MTTRLVFGLAAIMIACPLTRAGEIHLRRECTCADALVKLGHVAEIFADDESEMQQLTNVELFPSPAPGQVRRLAVRELYELLAARNVDMRRSRLAGASAVSITGASENNSEPTPPHQLPVTAEEENLVQLVVAARPLARGDLVHQSDVKLASFPARSVRPDAAEALGEVIGRELTRPIASGQPLQRATLQSPRLVRRNEVVTLLVRAHGIQVRTSAKAQEDGGLDDLIRLESLLDRNTFFTARVTAYKEAEILAGAPRVAESVDVAIKQRPMNKPKKKPTLFGLRVRSEDRAPDNR